MNNPDQLIIPYYSPISAKGGRRTRRQKRISRRHKKTRHNRRSKRRY